MRVFRSLRQQVVANILGQGSELRELARDVEDKLRQVELESIQVSCTVADRDLPIGASSHFIGELLR
jgi:hypothetical protein